MFGADILVYFVSEQILHLSFELGMLLQLLSDILYETGEVLIDGGLGLHFAGIDYRSIINTELGLDIKYSQNMSDNPKGLEININVKAPNEKNNAPSPTFGGGQPRAKVVAEGM